MVSTRKIITVTLSLLAVILLGAIVFIGTVQMYFGIDGRDMITSQEVAYWLSTPSLPYGHNLTTNPNGEDWSGNMPTEKIPRILHQTWKDENLPERWLGVREQCLEMHSDYEYMLWTDASSRAFIAKHYPWFLPVFDGYQYNIQRADVIRYFVLHHYGGIYLDLDVGCKRPIDPLLHFDVILPQTIPVGISNDLIFSSPRHPFMELVIHNLVTFDHTYLTNYPTVMFSTGPMFLSAQYNLWPSLDGDHGGVRVLPKHLYGKHATPEQSGEAFFSHFYGSSWHAEDAGLVMLVVRKSGVILIYVGLIALVLSAARFFWLRLHTKKQPISLPYSTHGTPHPDRSSTPLPISRPGSPAPLLRRAGSHDGTTGRAAGSLYWVPMWYPSAEAGANAQNSWSSYLPSLVFDSDNNRYRPVAPYQPGGATSDVDDDAVSIHSMHTIRAGKAPRRQQQHSKHHSSGPAYPSSSEEEDLEAGHGRRRASRRGSQHQASPPSYSSPKQSWSKWASTLFRSSSTSSEPSPQPSSSNWTPLPPPSPIPRVLPPTPTSADLKTPLSARSMPSSPAATTARSRSPHPPPEYDTDGNVEEEVDRLLNEMSPETHSKQ